jgi:hypothetical protein
VVVLAILFCSAVLPTTLVVWEVLMESGAATRQSSAPADGVIDSLVQKMHEYHALSVNNLFFVNGAAIVGLLTFLGHHFATDDRDRIKRGKLLLDRSIPAFMNWIAGLVCSLLLGFGLYQSLEAFIDEDLTELGILRAINGTLTLSGVAYFIAGTVFTCVAFIELSRGADNQAEEEKQAEEKKRESVEE